MDTETKYREARQALDHLLGVMDGGTPAGEHALQAAITATRNLLAELADGWADGGGGSASEIHDGQGNGTVEGRYCRRKQR